VNDSAITNKKNKITQSNEMMEAAYHLPLPSKRVLWLCLAQLKKGKEHDGVFNIEVSDYRELFNVSTTTASKDVKEGIDKLYESSVLFAYKDGEFSSEKKRWLTSVGTRHKKGSWSLKASSDVMPYIIGLSKRFTSFYLHECGKLNNPRTIRLYENLCQWRSTGYFFVRPDKLGARYDLPKSQCDNFAEMKRSFLDPALKRINRDTPMSVTLTVKKESVCKETGKETGKVTGLMFIIAGPDNV
jgi:plasmid replication initiation protein